MDNYLKCVHMQLQQRLLLFFKFLEDVLTKPSHHDTSELTHILSNSYLFPGKYWTLKSIQMINNSKLSQQYR